MESDALLAPIAGPSPSGEDLSFSNEFDRIIDMRREDDPTLDQGAWITSLKVADWPGVMEACSRLLTERSKDLRLAMWFTEASALTGGYEGLAKGLRLCAALCERYWSSLHPRPDGDDMEERIGNIGWLLQRIVGLSDSLPVTQGRASSARFSLRDLAAARQQQGAHERGSDDAKAVQPEAVTVELFHRALKETPGAVLMQTLEDARRCERELLAWQAIVDRHLGVDGPGFVQAKEALSHSVHEIERLAKEAGVLHPLSHEEEAQGMAALHAEGGGGTRQGLPPMAGAPGVPSSPQALSGPPQTRAQALQQLRDVAAFFRRSEPHSPVAYLAEKAVKWGEMPLHEWLRKVVKDQGAMSHLHELLGLDDVNEASP